GLVGGQVAFREGAQDSKVIVAERLCWRCGVCCWRVKLAGELPELLFQLIPEHFIFGRGRLGLLAGFHSLHPAPKIPQCAFEQISQGVVERVIRGSAWLGADAEQTGFQALREASEIADLQRTAEPSDGMKEASEPY